MLFELDTFGKFVVSVASFQDGNHYRGAFWLHYAGQPHETGINCDGSASAIALAREADKLQRGIDRDEKRQELKDQRAARREYLKRRKARARAEVKRLKSLDRQLSKAEAVALKAANAVVVARKAKEAAEQGVLFNRLDYGVRQGVSEAIQGCPRSPRKLPVNGVMVAS